MNVTMLVSVSTMDGNYAKDSDYNLPDILAAQWIKAGYAQAIEAEAEVQPVTVAVEEPAPVASVEAEEAAPVVSSRRGRKAKAVDSPKADLL